MPSESHYHALGFRSGRFVELWDMPFASARNPAGFTIKQERLLKRFFPARRSIRRWSGFTHG
jgi:hypothetical protein